MKKTMIIIVCAFLFASCGGGAGKESASDTIVSPEMQKIEQSSSDIKVKSEDLNKKADSILNNLNTK